MYGRLADFTAKYELRVHGLAGYFPIALFELEKIAKNYVENQKTNKEDYELFNMKTQISEHFHGGKWVTY